MQAGARVTTPRAGPNQREGTSHGYRAEYRSRPDLSNHFAGKRKTASEIEGEPDDMSSVNERRSLVAEARQTFGTQAARELWFEQRLPIVPSMMSPGQNDLYPWTMIRHGDLDRVA